MRRDALMRLHAYAQGILEITTAELAGEQAAILPLEPARAPRKPGRMIDVQRAAKIAKCSTATIYRKAARVGFGRQTPFGWRIDEAALRAHLAGDENAEIEEGDGLSLQIDRGDGDDMNGGQE